MKVEKKAFIQTLKAQDEEDRVSKSKDKSIKHTGRLG